MRQNLLNILLLFVTTVNAYGIVRLQQNTRENSREKYQRDTNGEFSYIVELQEWTRGSHHIINVARLCIGSAITEQWILTAGHCISKKLSHVEYGQKGNSKCSKVISTRLHPGFRMDYSYGGYYAILNNNIALVKAETMHLNHYARISARDYSTVLGEIVKYAGYGGVRVKKGNKSDKKHKHDDQEKHGERQGETSEEKENRGPEDLRVGEGGVIRCEQERYIIFQPAVCVAPKCGKHKLRTSQGDSGGPLTLDKKIIGVNSGYSPIMNDIFTPISPFFDWITSTIVYNKTNMKVKKNC